MRTGGVEWKVKWKIEWETHNKKKIPPQKVKDDRKYSICAEQRLYECLQLGNGELTVGMGEQKEIFFLLLLFVDENWNAENTTDSSDNGAKLLADGILKRIRYGESIMYANMRECKTKTHSNRIENENEYGWGEKCSSTRVKCALKFRCISGTRQRRHQLTFCCFCSIDHVSGKTSNSEWNRKLLRLEMIRKIKTFF